MNTFEFIVSPASFFFFFCSIKFIKVLSFIHVTFFRDSIVLYVTYMITISHLFKFLLQARKVTYGLRTCKAVNQFEN